MRGQFSDLDKKNIDVLSVLNSLSASILILDEENRICQVNSAAESLFESGSLFLCSKLLNEILSSDCPIFSLIDQARSSGISVTEYSVTIDSPRTGVRIVDIQVAPLLDSFDLMIVQLHEQSTAIKFGSQLVSMKSARSVNGIAALLAHEVKNPLSGIRGAAQIIEQNCCPEDKILAQLIRDECDRIFGLVDRMGLFSEQMPIDRNGVNIHSVLEHVRRIASAGFGRHVRFVEDYDPSLPMVLGDRDSLVQIFLNLVKNSVEAVSYTGGEIILGTAWQHGVKLAVAARKSMVHLPLVVKIQDNGSGIPDDIRPHLFDPFVSSKANGSGLGLSMVAKLVNDHGGVIEFDSQPRHTIFRVFLPTTQDNMGEI